MAAGPIPGAARVARRRAPALATQPASAGLYAQYGKRALDLLVVSVLIVLALPVVAIAALAVLFTSGWPVFYASDRLGAGGRGFAMWKLRTMVREADAVMARWQRDEPTLAARYATQFKLRHDPRITPLGRFLRKSSIDELPQLWNVLRGDMSLVGPRPYLPDLRPDADLEGRVLSVRPGITGPFQVGGRSKLGPRERMLLDAEYASGATLGADLRYLLRTAGPLLRMDGD